MVGYWATLSLNIPDFTRYARSQADQAVGQTGGLLITMPLFAFIGIAVTSATVLLYGEAIWNPVDLLTRLANEYRNPLLGVLAMFVILVATLTTNVAANVVAPANSFANLSSGRISFRTGGLIAGVLGIVILPWKLLDMYQGWLIAYSGCSARSVGS
jgi:NCS1 family nucleobase:cation symporter-1